MPQNPARHQQSLVLGGLTALLLLGLSVRADHTPDETRADDVAEQRAAHRPTRAMAAPGAGTARSDRDAETWRADQIVVAPAPGADIYALAEAHGAEVLREPGRANLATLSVPEGTPRAALIQALQADPAVTRAGRQGIVRGAGSGPSVDDQWHIEAGDFDESIQGDYSGYLVAVLDTGVAYEDYHDGRRSYTAAPCMSETTIVSPRDVVSQDDHPNDDHQHGTHIASIIVADCDIEGTAPGAALMPIKVLNQDNVGTEADLIEGLYWAIDYGADVINMSLTFGPGYVPSPELLDVLSAAADAGVVMVGAAGNDGLDAVGWPAASPHVIAVGAACAVPDHSEDMVPAPYTNRGPALDLLAGGGCLDRDVNDDGMPDGILAEGVAPGGGAPGYWLAAGTSQAAAVATGAVVRLLDTGIAPEHVRQFLQDKAEDNLLGAAAPFADGLGAGAVDIEDAVEEALDEPDKFEDDAYSAALMPMLRDNGDGTVTPGARWTVYDEDLDPAERVTVYGSLSGADGRQVLSCWLPDDGDGACTVWGKPVPAGDASGPRALGWEVRIDRVADDDVSFTPSTMLFASDALDDLVAATEADPELSGAVLGLYWEDGDKLLGERLAESWVVLSTGTGIATSPFGTILTPPLIEPIGRESSGTGIATSPFAVKILSLSGTGVATSPFQLTVIGLRGTGIATSPFAVLLGDDGDDDDDIEPFKLAKDSDDRLSGTSLGKKRAKGGWRAPTGELGGHAVAGSGLVTAPAEPVEHGASVGAVEHKE